MAESLIDGYKSWKKRKEMPQEQEEPEPMQEAPQTRETPPAIELQDAPRSAMGAKP